MNKQPRLEARDAVPYLGIPFTVTMDSFFDTVDQGFAELFTWLSTHSLKPAGAPFIRYLTTAMEAEMRIELAAPVAGPATTEGRVHAGTLPAGRYLTLVHIGSYDRLLGANAALQIWARAKGLRFAMEQDSTWRGRVEHYLTDPSQEPDPSHWHTEIAYLTDEM